MLQNTVTNSHGKQNKRWTPCKKKLYEEMDTEEVIDEFINHFKQGKTYPAKDFYLWHNRLTGSCKMGRDTFVKNKGIDLEKDVFTVKEFIDLTLDSYGGDVIRELQEEWDEKYV